MLQDVRAAWTCDVCWSEISEREGVLEFANGNTEHGAVGGYPRVSEDEWTRLSTAAKLKARGIRMARDGLGAGLALLRHEVQNPRPGNVRLRVHHRACVPAPKETPYCIDLARITSLPQLMNWIHHLQEERWFGKAETYQLLRAWYKAAGGRINPGRL